MLRKVEVVPPDPFRGNEGTEKVCSDPTVGPRLKVWIRDKKMFLLLTGRTWVCQLG